MNTQTQGSSTNVGKNPGIIAKALNGKGLEGLSLENLEHYVDELKDSVTEITDRSVRFVKEHPVYSLMGAAVLGFAAGAALKNSMKKH